ncbi:D-hexose-6-phosphate mutarotase [Chitinimonas sp. BJYL2]|uniref:D-hexose-6-phosphate mutarotase n=1 Tax=Chitinimonas sp. BJYL2 TaxID=2976696 RepID=UPI0022B375C9|nr:D-hexose-6-phosphate mutarotase [Chitinimonas sp. BJYL2]
MDSVRLTSPHGHATLTRHGAQALDAVIDGVPLLWLSPFARPETDQVIRGGVPLCFPWFGKHPDGLPSHGFARNRHWDLIEQSASHAVFTLQDDEAGRALWPHAFLARLRIELDQALRFVFEVGNRDDHPLTFTHALHTYFPVGDCRACEVTGLDGHLRREVGHADQVQSGAVRTDRPIDALFDQAEPRLSLKTPTHTILIETRNMPSAVIWNPGKGGEQIPDIGTSWPGYLCVERGNVGSAAVTLAPGAWYRGEMWLSVEPLRQT